MTGAQASYLKTLSEEAGEPFDESLSKADASLRIDKGMKLRSYAKAGIANYWIVALARQSVETCSDPIMRQRQYRQRLVLSGKEKLPVNLHGDVGAGAVDMNIVIAPAGVDARACDCGIDVDSVGPRTEV